MQTSPAPRTILVVDDDAQMRALLRDFLEREGHRVLESTSGEAAVSLVESEPLDVVILDKEMPGTNGLDVLSFLRHRCPAIPVILVTAFGGPRVAEEALRRGAVRYLDKPFRVSRILEVVREVTRA